MTTAFVQNGYILQRLCPFSARCDDRCMGCIRRCTSYPAPVFQPNCQVPGAEVGGRKFLVGMI